jgi:hypothetical protein
MHFHFCTANHSDQGRESLRDMMVWFRAGLERLGHRVTESDRGFDSGAVNILWELFTDQDANRLRQSGVRYGIVATEVADGSGFNQRRDGAWPERWAGFIKAAEGASFIWTTVERSVSVYAQLAPAAFIELGFVEELVSPFAGEEPSGDFFFLGSLTEYRRPIIERLRRHARVNCPGTIVRWTPGPRVMASARIGLALKLSADWPLPGPSRIGRILLARRGLAAEHTVDSTRQSRLVPAAPPDADFVNFALAKLGGPWRREAEIAFERYRSEMPMDRIMERVVDLTCPASAG